MTQSTVPVVVGTNENFEQEVLESPIPVVVDFWAPWCVWCRKMAPIYEAAASQWSDRVKFVTVNVDHERVLAERFGVMSLPTLKWFCGGREVGETIGAMSRSEFEEALQVLLRHGPECIKKSSPARRA